jgi:anti-anti-sigma factor
MQTSYPPARRPIHDAEGSKTGWPRCELDFAAHPRTVVHPMHASLDTGTPPPNRVELTSATDEIAIVALIGEHDLGHYEALKVVLARAAIRARNVIVDLSECAFIDSTTISLLLYASRVTTRYSGGFVVVITPGYGAVARLAELSRLDQVLSIQPSREAAMTSFESRRASDSAS